jgi:hypothetical protein
VVQPQRGRAPGDGAIEGHPHQNQSHEIGSYQVLKGFAFVLGSPDPSQWPLALAWIISRCPARRKMCPRSKSVYESSYGLPSSVLKAVARADGPATPLHQQRRALCARWLASAHLICSAFVRRSRAAGRFSVGGGGPIRGSQPPLLALPRRKATHCADKLCGQASEPTGYASWRSCVQSHFPK